MNYIALHIYYWPIVILCVVALFLHFRGLGLGRRSYLALVPFLNLYECTRVLGWSAWCLLLLIPLPLRISLDWFLLFLLGSHLCLQSASKSKLLPFLGAAFPFFGLPLIKSRIIKGVKPRWDLGIFSLALGIVMSWWVGISVFSIPSESMRPTLKQGDFVFANKMHYGLNIGNQVFRFPWQARIQRGDVLIFHNARFKNQGKKRPWQGDHFTKRCLGLPGDSVEVKYGRAFVNGEAEGEDYQIQELYQVFPAEPDLIPLLGNHPRDFVIDSVQKRLFLHSNSFQLEKIQRQSKNFEIKAVLPEQAFVFSPAQLFPHNFEVFPFTNRQWGPVYCPKKGDRLLLNRRSYFLYKDIIEEEGHSIDLHGNIVSIDGQIQESYSVKEDHYLVLGDNRFSSNDSRHWGFLSRKKIKGKTSFLWFGTEGGIFNRGFFKRL